MRIALSELGLVEKENVMKKIRNLRLVCACLNCLAGISRLVAALVDMANYYPSSYDTEVGTQIRT